MDQLWIELRLKHYHNKQQKAFWVQNINLTFLLYRFQALFICVITVTILFYFFEEYIAYMQILGMFNMSDITLMFCIIAMSVTAASHYYFIQNVYICLHYLNTKFHVSSSNSSLVSPSHWKLTNIYAQLPCCYFIFHKNIVLTKSRYFSKVCITTQHCRTQQ
jgi:hypothetical protein